MKIKRAIPYDVTIGCSINNGFIVKVGCKTLVYTDIEPLLDDLEEYLTDPNAVIEKYNESRLEGVVPTQEEVTSAMNNERLHHDWLESQNRSLAAQNAAAGQLASGIGGLASGIPTERG